MAQSANAIRARPNFRQCHRLPGSAAPCRKTWQKRGWDETVSRPPRTLQHATIEAQHRALRLGRRSAVRRQAQEEVVVRQREFPREPGSALGDGLLVAASQQPRAVAAVRPVDVASTVGQPFGQSGGDDRLDDMLLANIGPDETARVRQSASTATICSASFGNDHQVSPLNHRPHGRERSPRSR